MYTAKPVPTMKVYKEKNVVVINVSDYKAWNKNGWKSEKDINKSLEKEKVKDKEISKKAASLAKKKSKG